MSIVVTDMTRAEAEAITQNLKNHISDMWAMLLEMRDRKGWKALGYASFEAWGESELGFSKPHLYRLASAAEVQANLKSLQLETTGIPESQLRPLAQLPAKDQAEAFQIAKSRAETDNGGKITAKIVEAVVRERTASPKPQVIETQAELGSGEEQPLIVVDHIHMAATVCEPWESRFGEVLKLIEALPPIYQVYASHAVNKVVKASAVREWKSHPSSDIHLFERYHELVNDDVLAERVAMSNLIGSIGIPSLSDALLHGKIDTYPAVLVASLPVDHQSAAMERLEIPINEPQVEIPVPNISDIDGLASVQGESFVECVPCDSWEVEESVSSQPIIEKPTSLVLCNVCGNFRPRLKRCDAGHTETINFNRSRKMPGKFRLLEPRACSDFKSKSAAMAGNKARIIDESEAKA